MEYINKKGVVVTLGKTRTEFPNGAKVIVKSFVNGKPAEVPGVNIGVKFDFDAETWYSANLTQTDVDKYLQVGKAVDIKTWSKESGGKTYHNFAIVYPKKPDVAQVEAKFNPLIQTVEQHGKQIMSLHARLQALELQNSKKETTTMFDTDAKDVFPEEYEALYGPENASAQSEYEQYEDPSEIPFM